MIDVMIDDVVDNLLPTSSLHPRPQWLMMDDG
jgi:hypothetical protein